MPGARPHQERRDTSVGGVWNRKQFEASVSTLRSLGLSPRALEHFRLLARATRRLPHELALEILEETAVHPNAAIQFLLYARAGRGDGI